MDPHLKIKDFHGNNTIVTASAIATLSSGAVGGGGGGTPSGGVAMTGICSSDSFSLIPPLQQQQHNEMVSANSIDLNAAASLSDDSGVPLTTNSSISSGDSYRMGMCKFEIEVIYILN